MKILFENQESDIGRNLLQGLTDRFATNGLDARRNYRQLRFRGLQENLGVVDAGCGEGIVSGAAEHLAKKGADIGRRVYAKHAWPGVGAPGGKRGTAGGRG